MHSDRTLLSTYIVNVLLLVLYNMTGFVPSLLGSSTDLCVVQLVCSTTTLSIDVSLTSPYTWSKCIHFCRSSDGKILSLRHLPIADDGCSSGWLGLWSLSNRDELLEQ
jgi:hypothetical protein